MNKKAKLLKKLYTNPKDFTFNDTVSLLGFYKYVMDNKGRTSGSRIAFIKGNKRIYMHRPHPGNELKSYQIKELRKKLEEEKEND